MAFLQAVPADPTDATVNKLIDHQVETIWQMALASFAANNNNIVLPLEYEKSLSPDVIEELKARLSRRLGCETFVVADPATSAFRIFGMSTPAVQALAHLGPTNFSLAGKPLESIINQTKEKLAEKGVSSDHVRNQQANKDKEKRSKIPRPPNAFILYRQHYHPLIKAKNPDFHNNDISRVLGKQWKEESPAVREIYKAQALARKAEHLKMHPDYQYAPRKPGEKKRRATRKGTEAGGDKEQYETLRFIDQDGEFYTGSESGSGVGDDDMDVIRSNVDGNAQRFHLDGEGNVGVILPAAHNANLTKMVEAHNKRAEHEDETFDFHPADDIQVTTSIPPHVQNDTNFFDALIDWDGITEDFKTVQQASGEDLAGLSEVETGNPYLSLSDEDQRFLFEAELERTLKFFQ